MSKFNTNFAITSLDPLVKLQETEMFSKQWEVSTFFLITAVSISFQNPSSLEQDFVSTQDKYYSASGYSFYFKDLPGVDVTKFSPPNEDTVCILKDTTFPISAFVQKCAILLSGCNDINDSTVLIEMILTRLL